MANLNMINMDLSRNLYADAYINFLSSIPRPLMEDFAAQIADAGTAESVAQVYDQYLNFIVSEPDLFSLSMGKETYWALNSAQPKDEEIDAVVDRIVSGLFSVVVTMGESDKSQLESWTHLNSRRYPNNSLPARCSSRSDCSKTRSQAQRSRFEFERQPVFQSWSTARVRYCNSLFKTDSCHR